MARNQHKLNYTNRRGECLTAKHNNRINFSLEKHFFDTQVNCFSQKRLANKESILTDAVKKSWFCSRKILVNSSETFIFIIKKI